MQKKQRKASLWTLTCNEPSCGRTFEAVVVTDYPDHCPECRAFRRGKGRNEYMKNYMRTYRAARRDATLQTFKADQAWQATGEGAKVASFKGGD